MEVFLVDGTYELFRHFFGRSGREAGVGQDVAATRGVLRSLVGMLAAGTTHMGVATDKVIESFRNDLWPGYKTGEGVDPLLMGQFRLLEDSLDALGLTVWPMVELEADDALASAAAVAADDTSVERVLICTPDKDLSQCVVGTRVVTLDRRSDTITDEDGVWRRFGVAPHSIPDWLALVGDSADGFPGLAGWGRQTASAVLAHYGKLEAIPGDAREWDAALRSSVRGAPKLAARLAEDREAAFLFRVLATLQVERTLLPSVDELAWTGPRPGFDEACRRIGDPELPGRVAAILRRR